MIKFVKQGIPLAAVVFFLCLTFQAKAQLFYIGGKYTLNFTRINNEFINQSSDQGYRPSFGNNYGLIIGYHFTDGFGIKVNLLLNKHIQRYESLYLDTVITQEVQSETGLTTFDIPVLLNFGKKVYFETGPVFSFITQAQYTSETIGTMDVKEEFSKANLGIAAGLGTNFPLTQSIWFNFGFRYTYGFVDMKGIDAKGQSIENLKTITQKDWKSNTYSIGVYAGLKFLIYG